MIKVSEMKSVTSSPEWNRNWFPSICSPGQAAPSILSDSLHLTIKAVMLCIRQFPATVFTVGVILT